MTATLSAKGQIVIPARMRRKLGLKPSARLEIEERPGGLFIRSADGEVPEYVPEMPPGSLKLTKEEIRVDQLFAHYSEFK